jgi:hypothetical protein
MMLTIFQLVPDYNVLGYAGRFSKALKANCTRLPMAAGMPKST